MDGFQNFLKIIGLNILTGIFVALWSLLFRHTRHHRRLPLPPGAVPAARPPRDGRPGSASVRASGSCAGTRRSSSSLDTELHRLGAAVHHPFVSVYTLPHHRGTYALYYSMLREHRPRPRPQSRPRSLVQQLKRRKKAPAVSAGFIGLRPGSGGGLHEADQDGRAHGAVGAAGGVEGGAVTPFASLASVQ